MCNCRHETCVLWVGLGEFSVGARRTSALKVDFGNVQSRKGSLIVFARIVTVLPRGTKKKSRQIQNAPETPQGAIRGFKVAVLKTSSRTSIGIALKSNIPAFMF